MKKYEQLIEGQRYQIYALKKAGQTNKEIALIVRTSESTVTLVDRKSKFTLIKKVESKHAEDVTAATVELLKPYKDKVWTMTADNGEEFASHETMNKELDTQVYFAPSYRSWERGLKAVVLMR